MENFSSSLFFPKIKIKKSKLQQCVEKNIPIFSKDINKNGAKSFFCCGYEYFIKSFYKNQSSKNIYEVIQEHKPTKVFLDFDCLSKNCSRKKFDNDFNDFINKSLEVLAKNYDDLNEDEIDVLILDSTTKEKYSFHVILQIAFENLTMVKNFIDYVLSICPNKYVDKSIYTKNRSFRLIYSSKLNKNIPLKLLGDENCLYNEKNVFLSLIQCITPTNYKGEFKNTFQTSKIRIFNSNLCSFKKRKITYQTSEEFITLDDLPKNLIQYIQICGGVIRTIKETKEFLYLIIGNTKCPFINKQHKSNNQFFTLCKNNRIGYWKCADSECPNIIYDKLNLDFLF